MPQKVAPALLSAALLENQPGNSIPEEGENLELYLDEAIELVGGALLTSADLTLSAGNLGAITTAPVLQDSRRVLVTLGAGVSFTPGTDTLSFSSTQDALRSTATKKLAAGGNPVVVKVGDADQPFVTAITLNAIPTLLNGGGAAGGTLQTPPNSFTIDLGYSDGSSPIDTTAFQVTVDKPANVGGTQVPGGTNLFGSLTQQGVGSTAATFSVPTSVELSTGAMLLTVVVFDASGRGCTPVNFQFQVAALTDGIRPFETSTNPSQVWFIDLSRDLDAITSSGSSTITIGVTPGANGVSDLGEILRVIGLQSATPIPNVSGTKDSNQVAMELLQAEVLSRIAALTPGVNVSYRFDSPGTFPNALQVAYSAATFSRICVSAVSDIGALGIALFDTNNTTQDDDCAHPGTFAAVINRLGVFVHSLVELQINSSSASFFRVTFDPFTLGRGTPIGNHSGDAVRLQNLVAGNPGDSRQDLMETALDRLAHLIAVGVAHETGHSMGLADGPMPSGLYGGDDDNFPGSSSGHIDLSSTTLFPPGAQEVMSPAISFEASDSPSTGFNVLELSYLRERVLYNLP
jgi:hypothetical protein